MLFTHRRALNARVAKLFCAGIIAAFAMSAAPAVAQNAPTKAETAANDALAEIIVTGTSIRGVAPIGSELITFSQHDIVATSASTVTDILRKMPSLSGLNASPPIRADPLDSINLPSIHGLAGTGLVLVLFDGYRAVGSGIIANSPDPSSIPASALERVEVVPDGASSIYGSDAVTGVINLVLRRNLDGFEINARDGIARPYNRADASMAWGHTWDGGHVMFAYQFTNNSKLSGKDRTFYGIDQRNRTEDNGVHGMDFRDTGCDPGTIYVGPNKTSYALPAINTAGSKNLCDYTGDNSLIPQETRNNVVLSAHQDITDKLELWGESFWAMHTAEKDTVQAEATGFTITNTNPYFQVPKDFTPAGGYTGAPITSEGFDYSPRNIIGGPLHDDLTYKTVSARGGLTWKMPHSWQGKFVLNLGKEDDLFTGQKTNAANLTAAIAGTTIATALNPYGPSAPTVVASLRDDLRDDYATVQKLTEGIASFDGPLFHMTGGDAKLAVGLSWRKETYDGVATSGTAGISSPAVRYLVNHAYNQRIDKSEYAELYLPLVGAPNEMTAVHRLDVSLSVRHDDYDDFGATTNPKYGISWSPFAGFTLRGNYSTSFHAPNLADDTVPSIDSHAQAFCCIFPPPTSPPGTPGLYTIILNGGTKGLQPEKAKNYSLGFDEIMESVPGLKFGASYFHTSFSNQIGYLPPQYLYSGGAASKFYTVNPTLAQELAFIAGYPLQVSSINGGALPGLLLDIRRSNIGAVNFAGVDFNISYAHALGNGELALGLNGTRLTLYETQAVEGAGSFVSELGTGQGLAVHPVKWQARGNIGWANEIIDAAAYLNYSGKYLFYANNVYHPVRAYTPVDLHLGVTPFKGNLLKTTQLTLDIDNVFDEDPPYVDEGVPGDNAGNGYDKRAANPIGRLVTVGFRSKF
jgi:iron complex outermembrane receptor protein